MRYNTFIFCWIICFFFFINHKSIAQIQVTGVIVDSISGSAICDALISYEDTRVATYSQSDGKFVLEIPNAGFVSITMLGYTSKRVQIDKDVRLKVELKPDYTLINQKGRLIQVTGRAINLKLPASLMKIYPEHLKRDPDISIEPFINRVSGVFMHTGALNTNRITIRGIGNRSPFSTTKIRAYLDDIPLTSGDGETTVEDIDLSLVENISVWKGPTASNFGAGLGGMIHLQTQQENQKNTSNLENNLTVGSFGLIRNVTKGNYSNKSGSLQIGANVNVTHNNGYRANNEYDRKGGALLIKYIPNKNSQTTFFGNWIDLKAFIPSSLNIEDYRNAPQKAAFTWANVKGFEDYSKKLLGISHQHKLGSFGKYTLSNKTSVFSNLRDSYESRPFNILSEDSNGLGFRSTLNLNTNKQSFKPLFSIGIEHYREKYNWKTLQTNNGIEGEVISDNAEKRSYYNIFLQSFYPISDKATLFAGLNVNSTRYKYDDLLMVGGVDKSGGYGFDAIFSPHVGLSYQFDYKLSIFGSISHGFSPPSLSETLTPDGTPNPTISPEQGWNFEIGSRGRIGEGFTYELTAYTMQIKDLLVAKRIAEDQFIGLNAGETNHNGIELFLEQQTSLSNGLMLTSFLTYTYSNYKFVDFVDNSKDYSGNELTGTPPHQLNVGVDVSTDIGFYSSLNLRYVDAFPMRDDNSVYSEAYTVANLKFGYQKQLFDFIEIDISAGIRNVFNEKYASMILINAGSFGGNLPRYYYPGLPRNFFTTFSINMPISN